MKEEFGKWLMDISKYITMAVILSSMFGGIEDAWVMYMLGTLAVAASLLGGLWLQRKPKQKDH